MMKTHIHFKLGTYIACMYLALQLKSKTNQLYNQMLDTIEMQERVLEELHIGHTKAVSMKSLSKSYVAIVTRCLK